MADCGRMNSIAELERAIACSLADRWSADPDVVDCDASFFDPMGFSIGDHIFSSLEIVEMMIALEVEFEVPIIIAGDPTEFESVAKLSTFIGERVEHSTASRFVERWPPLSAS
jgi:acyl carrier protein